MWDGGQKGTEEWDMQDGDRKNTGWTVRRSSRHSYSSMRSKEKVLEGAPTLAIKMI